MFCAKHEIVSITLLSVARSHHQGTAPLLNHVSSPFLAAIDLRGPLLWWSNGKHNQILRSSMYGVVQRKKKQ